MSELMRALMNAKALEADRVRRAYQDIAGLSIPGNLSEDFDNPATPSTRNKIDVENLITDPLGRGGLWSTIWNVGFGTMRQVDVADLPRFPFAVQATAVGGSNSLRLGATFAPEVPGIHYFYALVKSDWVNNSNQLRIRKMFAGEESVGSVTVAGSLNGWSRVGGSANLTLPATTLNGGQTLPLASIKVASTANFPTSGTIVIAGMTITYTGKTSENFTGCAGGEGTIPTGTPVTAGTPGPMILEMVLTSPVTVGKVLYVTAPTVVAGVDPLEPITGDLAVTSQNAYNWAGGRHTSRSRRYARAVDLMALREEEAKLSVAPEGMTLAQRQAYLLARWQARRKPWAEVFVDLIVQVIRSENPSFKKENVRLLPNYQNYSFQVQIAYSPTGVLADRVKRLIEDCAPAHLNCNPNTDIIWGTFIAGINKAGDVI